MLRGKIAYLSYLSEADDATMLSWINDRHLVLSSASFRPVHQSCHLEWFHSIQRRPDVVIFGVRRISDDLLVGSCQLHSISLIHRSAELQIRIGCDVARGVGIGSEVCSMLLSYAFRDLNLNRVYLHVFEGNERAMALYKRSGFKVEGVLQQAAYIDGDWVNVVIMAILRNEYLAS